MLVVRRHPLVLSAKILTVVLVAWVPWLVFVLGSGFGLLFSLLFFFTAAAGVMYLYVVWSDWFNSLSIVTNNRVITTHQHNLWQRQVREVPLAKIQEVRHDQRGLIKIALHVGDVIVRTAAAELIVRDVSQPASIEQRIGSLIHKEHKPKPAAPVEY